MIASEIGLPAASVGVMREYHSTGSY
jgi:hypothetical protein